MLGLSADQVDPDRPLVAMGLDSIAAMELKLDIDQYVGAKVPFSVLSEGTSIRDVAGKVLGHLETIAATPDVPSPPSEPVPAPAAPQPSHGQRMLWYAHQFAPEGAAYHIAGEEWSGRTWISTRSVGHSDGSSTVTMRSGAHSRPCNGEPSLRLLETDDLAAREEEWLVIEDATGLDQAAISTWLTERFRRPFDIERGPLFRFHMLRISDAEHVVLPVFHHIISDFLSAAVFLDDLGRAYLEEAAGRLTSWSPATSFYDFARQQEQMLSGEEGERLWDYWRRRLDGPLPLLDLPTDHPRPIVRGERGKTYRDALDPELSAALASMGEARREPLHGPAVGVPDPAGAWAGQDEVIVGSPVAQRTQAGQEGMVGYLVNMLPMRAGLADDPCFDEFLARARRSVGEGLEHLEFPFSRMVERLGAAPDPGRAPIFQVMYAHQRTQRLDEQGLAPFALGVPGARLDLHGLAIDSATLDRETALFELALMTARDGDRLRMAWEYSTELFAEKTIATMASGFRALLEAIVNNPGRRLSEMPVLSGDDRHRALEWWASGPEATRSEGGIHHRFECEAAAAPDATALVFDGGSLTYAELNRRANILARELIGRGLGPEAVVGLFLDDWPLRLVGILGVLKAGAAYLPLDPSHPDPRLASAFEDSRAAALVTEVTLRDRVSSLTAGPVVDLDALLEAQDDPGNAGVPVDAGNLAYVIYTSGTTGRPKGVMVHHGALMSVGSAWERLYDLRGSVRRHLQASPFAFDVFTGDWVRALTTGGTLISCPREVVLDPWALANRIRGHEVDALELVPALAEALAEHLEDEPGGGALPMRLLALGSDTLRSGLIRRLERRLTPGARVVNSYGLTEAAVDSLCFDPVAEGVELPEGDGDSADRAADGGGPRLCARSSAGAGAAGRGGRAVHRRRGRGAWLCRRLVEDRREVPPRSARGARARGCTRRATGPDGARAASSRCWGASTTS